MAITFEELLHIKRGLEDEYEADHETFQKLRLYYEGNYWDQADSNSDSLTTLFRDMVPDLANFGPDIKVTNNLLHTIVTKYQSFLSTAPMIRMYVDSPGNSRQRAQSTLKERYLYGIWSEGKMSQVLGQLGWYLPLFGHGFIGAFPDLRNNRVTPVLRSPEIAYPIPSYDGFNLDGVIFCWEVRQSTAMRAFPKYTPDKPGIFDRLKGKSDTDPMVKIYEYSDSKEWSRWIDGQKVNGVEHELGFNLFDQAKFIDVPGRVFGHGAVKQIVQQVEMGNALESLLMQAVIDNVFPSLVLIDAAKAPEQIERGPGSVIPINQGGDAKYLNAPVNVQAGVTMLERNRQQIQQNSNMPDVSFGTQHASVITGKAVNELQGAGTGSTVEMVQTNIGPALVGFNEKAIYLAQTLLKDEMIYLQGFRPETVADINPRQFAFKAKGSQLVGSARNEVVFQPHMDLQTKVVVGLQMAGAGLVSKQWQREQAGIPDSAAMDEEILAEAVQDAVLGFVIGSLDPSNPDITGATNFIETGAAPGAGSAPPPGAALPPAPPGVLGAAAPPQQNVQATLGASGKTTLSSQTNTPIGEPPPEQLAPAPNALAPEGAGVTIDQAASAVQAVGQTQGRVFLVGDIVIEGETEDEVEIAVTEQADISALQGLPFPTEFITVSDVPQEQYVEVTPGQPVAPGGEELTLESLGA